MGGLFFLFGIYALKNNDLFVTIILVWAGIVFSFIWLIHFLKVNYYINLETWIVRDLLLKYCFWSVILFPFLFIKYVALLIQSFGKEKLLSQVTDKIFIGQQLLWFHIQIFTNNKIGAVLDITVENREPWFIVMNKAVSYLRIPVLDKTSPSLEQLEEGVAWGLWQMGQGKKLYVHCGAGHERSATFASAILLRSGQCNTLEEAMKQIRRSRPKARFVGDQQMILTKWSEQTRDKRT